MQFGKVIGNIIASRKSPCGVGLPLLVVRLLDENLQPTAKTIACTDTVNARQGDIVLTCGSSSARMTERTKHVCTDNAIIAVIDTVSQNKTDFYRKDSNSE
ncbi:EutN/CcmL family microcompartment protein [candidate division KSB1 bacterium]|nr:EutN/CcmL family microcompartment protein [candidate division KSB1 bacterium]